jgi:hypothetical protein
LKRVLRNVTGGSQGTVGAREKFANAAMRKSVLGFGPLRSSNKTLTLTAG